MILPALIGELRLQEHVGTRDDAGAVRGRQRVADRGLDVVPALIRGIDAPKPRAQRELGEGGGAVFFPGGAVQEVRRHSAFGATDTPRAPVSEMARATRPEALASS